MKIINKTPHDVNVVDEKNNVLRTYLRSDSQIRISSQIKRVGFADDGTPLTVTEYGEAYGLPEYVDGVYYIVSALVKNALPERSDLLIPAEQVRDGAGMVIGCKSLGK